MADVGPLRPVRRLLVANRGEIARRIFRTAAAMGVSTAAVYADGDRDAPFVREADAAVALHGRSAAETYLDIAKILDACRRVGADAVHPGYGFLSENPSFAQAAVDAGLTWIGPSASVIAMMGDKLSAKRVMTQAGVPTLPAAEIPPGADLQAAARSIGYPVLVKASAGGGGRGMRVVLRPDALEEAVEGARREAAGAFGDATVFLEAWLEGARHVEIQILGDLHGSLVHCFERECSIQRRHQKIIEEAPSPGINEDVRAAMAEAALAAARALGYASAGTVEFLVKDGRFFFLEVNARLQVEHPVTEAVTGLDLVREQIRIAEGEPLSFTQADLVMTGHAIEARLCAEDCERDFLPAPGVLEGWAPSAAGGARFDSGVEAGSVVGSEFDAMIAKVIVHAPTRREAAARLARALETTKIHGLTTNRDFLVSTLRTPAFLSGDTTTDFIGRIRPQPRRTVTRAEIVSGVAAAVLEGQARRRAAARVLKTLPSGWRLAPAPLEEIAFDVAGERVTVRYRAGRDGAFRLVVDGEDHLARPLSCGAGRVDMDLDGLRSTTFVERTAADWRLHGPFGDLQLSEAPRYPPPRQDGASGGLAAPMPGLIRTVAVAPGEDVVKGQLLLTLEAMKMEHRVVAPHDGRVGELHVEPGEQVANGQRLLTLARATTGAGPQ